MEEPKTPFQEALSKRAVVKYSKEIENVIVQLKGLSITDASSVLYEAKRKVLEETKI